MTHIHLRDVSVEFPIYNASGRSLKNSLLHYGTGGRIGLKSGDRVCVQALQNINCTLREGDRVALIGHNGAGKTTLLRVLAGIYYPSSGSIMRSGRVAPLFDVMLGMDLESSGYDNILLRGLFLGLSRSEIAERREEISAFTELGDYLSMPVRTYSSGMMLRLAFAVSTCFDPEILVLDEWLSVGDATFVAKAEHRLEQLITRSQILIFASHSRAQIERVCNRAFLLEHGRLVREGSVQEIYEVYEQKNESGTVPPPLPPEPPTATEHPVRAIVGL